MKQKAHEGFQVEFLGTKVPVRNTAVGVLVLEAQSNGDTLKALVTQLMASDSAPSTSAASSSGHGSEQMEVSPRRQSNAAESIWDKLDTLFVDTFSKYDDAARAVQNELSALKSQATQDQFRIEELQVISCYNVSV